MTTSEFDVPLPGRRVLHGYDSHPGDHGRLVVVWHHGTPNIGRPPVPPLAEATDRLGLRWVSYDRPGYGGSTPVPDRPVGSAATDVAALTDHLGIDRFAVMGHSGGGPHALACAALLPGRVVAAVSVAGLAPFDAAGLDWFAGMGPGGEATLRAAAQGRPAKEAFEAAAHDDEPDFVESDLATLGGPWGWLGSVVGPALVAGPTPLIDDDLAYVSPWGFDPAGIGVPVQVVHGELDRIVPVGHGRWLAAHIPGAEFVTVPDAGHIAVLERAFRALEFIRAMAGHRPG